jgi:hypothetical protein
LLLDGKFREVRGTEGILTPLIAFGFDVIVGRKFVMERLGGRMVRGGKRRCVGGLKMPSEGREEKYLNENDYCEGDDGTR